MAPMSARAPWLSCRIVLLALAALLAAPGRAPAEPTAPAAPAVSLSPAAAGRFVALALACVHREYPNKLAHALDSDVDVLPPRDLTPAFFGCYDWHSAVHAHWMLARAARLYPTEAFAARARAALDESLTPVNIGGELAYLGGPGRGSFERPYGLSWLLMLAAELRVASDTDLRHLATNLAPLEELAADHIRAWLPRLHYPTRTGEHSQTAFAFGLIWEWASVAADRDMQARLAVKAREFYLADRDCPLGYEPSGEDFLSPCLAEADFMRRVLAPADFGRWLHAFLPGIPRWRTSHAWLRPGIVTDRSDPRLAHLDGLNLSRAWMLEGIAQGLPAGDRRVEVLRAAAAEHRAVALPAVTGEHYSGGHWLASFALFLTSGADLSIGP
jgi:hypothetical protein